MYWYSRDEGNVVLDMAMSYIPWEIAGNQISRRTTSLPGGYDKEGNAQLTQAIEGAGRYSNGLLEGKWPCVVLDLSCNSFNGNCTAQIDKIGKGS